MRAARWIAAEPPLFALNVLLIDADELWALRYPETHELHVLERGAGGPHGGRHLEHASAAGSVRVRSADLGRAPAVVVASEPMDEDPGWRAIPSGHLLHVAADLTVTSASVLDAPPAHPLTLADWARRRRRRSVRRDDGAQPRRLVDPLGARGCPVRNQSSRTMPAPTKLPTPKSRKAPSVSMWSASQPKFIPKKPVMNVSGRKIVAISVSRLAVSFWRTLISFCSTEITAMFAWSTIASRSRWAMTSSLTSFRWSLTSR